MSYQDFLAEFARAQGVGTVEALLGEHAERYSFQINSRKRAQDAVDLLKTELQIDFAGKKVLDVGCAYGSHSIELAQRGAQVTGIDISNKWLGLAAANARGDAEVEFINCDASSRRAQNTLGPRGPFDLVLVNDVFEHIFDTAGLLRNLQLLMKPGAALYYKVPNGMATRSVLSEGHKKKFGISLLPPDYWHMYIAAPFHIYYRRMAYFDALFAQFGFVTHKFLTNIGDANIQATRKFIQADLIRIDRTLKAQAYETPAQLAALRNAIRYYMDEVKEDLQKMEWWDLFMTYRATFWEGIIKRPETQG
jgi:2-polyprenyl-3-methyl-5-hydroxy-6-metoxy-1,4-benzoquinol methylase